MKENLPLGLIAIFNDPDYKGSALVDLGDTSMIRTPSAKEISRNYVWLLPVVKTWPSKARIANRFVSFVSKQTQRLAPPFCYISWVFGQTEAACAGPVCLLSDRCLFDARLYVGQEDACSKGE